MKNIFALGFAPITVPKDAGAYLTLSLYAIDEVATREAFKLLGASPEPDALREKAKAMPTEWLRATNRDYADMLELDARLIVAKGMVAKAEADDDGTLKAFLRTYQRLVREAAERRQEAA